MKRSLFCYNVGEAILLLFFPVYMAFVAFLNILVLPHPLLTNNMISLINAGIHVVLAAAVVLYLTGLRHTSPERLRVTDRHISIFIGMMFLLTVFCLLRRASEALGMNIFPDPHMDLGFADLAEMLLAYVLDLAALYCWLRGTRREQAVLALCGAVLFLSCAWSHPLARIMHLVEPVSPPSGIASPAPPPPPSPEDASEHDINMPAPVPSGPDAPEASLPPEVLGDYTPAQYYSAWMLLYYRYLLLVFILARWAPRNTAAAMQNPTPDGDM